MHGGIIVNPWEQDGLVAALHRYIYIYVYILLVLLTLPFVSRSLTCDAHEMRNRIRMNSDYVMTGSATKWALHILTDIKFSKAQEEVFIYVFFRTISLFLSLTSPSFLHHLDFEYK